MWMWHGNGWWWLVMSVGMVVFWGGLSVVLVAALRPRARPVSAPKGPELILAERYASGEIDEEEYRRRLTTLHVTAPQR